MFSTSSTHISDFWADLSTKIATLASDWLRLHFTFLQWLKQFCIGRKQVRFVIKVLYQISVCEANRPTNMAALDSELLRHFLLLCNGRTEFEETWQEVLNILKVCIFFWLNCKKNVINGTHVYNIRLFRYLVCGLVKTRHVYCSRSMARECNIQITSLHENFFEPLAHRHILLPHCIPYKRKFSRVSNFVILWSKVESLFSRVQFFANLKIHKMLKPEIWLFKGV